MGSRVARPLPVEPSEYLKLYRNKKKRAQRNQLDIAYPRTMKQGQTKEKQGTIHKSSQHNSKKGKGQNTKKAKFHELIARQKQIKDIKIEKRKAIERKREERLHNRKERNISMQKLTRKGQPVMKHRIKLLLKQLCPGDT